jgi:Short C-terminal domain
MPGLIRGVARTAAIAGTATAVSNRVSRRQARRWGEQEAYNAPEPAYQQAPQAPQAPPAPAADPIEQLTQLAALRDQGVLTDVEFSAQKAKILST